MKYLTALAAPVSICVLGACSGAAGSDPVANVSQALSSGDDSYATGGAVFTIDNAADANHVLAFERGADGSLTPAGEFATGGAGSGSGLGTQGALALSPDGRFLLVVNAGSNDISTFSVHRAMLELRGRVPSGGTSPGSVAISDDLVFALNTGGTNNVSGFSLDDVGTLRPLHDSTQALSASSVGPAQVGFSRDGSLLIVTEKGTNDIDTFAIGPFRNLEPIQVHASTGETPFGFAVTPRGALIVSDAAGGAAEQGALSSYEVSARRFDDVGSAVRDEQTAPCWVAVTDDGRSAYTTNAHSGNISDYDIGADGSLSLRSTVSSGAGSTPLDLAFDEQSRFLYVIDAGTHAIVSFRRGSDGSIVAVGPVASGLPTTAGGIAVR